MHNYRIENCKNLNNLLKVKNIIYRHIQYLTGLHFLDTQVDLGSSIRPLHFLIITAVVQSRIQTLTLSIYESLHQFHQIMILAEVKVAFMSHMYVHTYDMLSICVIFLSCQMAGLLRTPEVIALDTCRPL